jgi:exonuclease 3'-5' domain-containing protein 1
MCSNLLEWHGHSSAPFLYEWRQSPLKESVLLKTHANMEAQMIDSPSALKTFIDDLPDCKGSEPSLYVDLEGNNLSRKGTLSLITILVEPRHTFHLVDVTGLGKQAFQIAGSDQQTLRSILESQEILKVFFDIRNDSDALFGLFGIRVGGIEDVQLMELASRSFPKRYINGLAKCIERDSTLSFSEKREWKASKERGHKLFDPNLGGGYAVFDERPLSTEIEKYCVQDVLHMPALRELYRAKLCDAWWRKIETETAARIELSQGRSFNGQGMHMAKGPASWQDWRPSAAEMRSRILLISRRDSAVTRMIDVGSTISNQRRQGEEYDVDLSEIFEALNVGRGRSGPGRSYRYRSGFDVGDDRDDDFGDFTACDSECGYCGGCDY